MNTKKFYRLIVALFLFVVCEGAWAHTLTGIVIVRFRPNATELIQWKLHQRNGEIPFISSLVGPHTTSGYISDGVIRALDLHMDKLRRRKSLSSTQATLPSVFPATTQLENICMVRYDADVPPALVASKLSKHPSVLYAEPLPDYTIDGIPNDPLSVEQYHLTLTKATTAWDEVAPNKEPVVVGIIDTGVDTTHNDLQGQIWHNPGEVGQDANGKDRRFNKTDDDGNGFVDDWYGWDFVGSDGNTPDNTPLPGNDHGTHVAGLVGAVINNNLGVAGMTPFVTLMPVKVGRDDVNSRNVEGSGNGILYAAANGARVINCSFGSSSPSFADLDVVTSATEMGALVVAAAGNSSLQQAFYPAAHPPVLSVAATDKTDERAYFSNFHSTVDVCAPGVGITSTMPGNRYQPQDGTSMASPIVAGGAALVAYAYSDLTPEQLHTVMKANADNVDSLNASFVGLIGSGRLNVAAAVRKTNPYGTEIIDVVTSDSNNDGAFEAGETITIQCKVHNILSPLTNARLVITPAPSNFEPIILVQASDVGAIASGDTATPVNDFVVKLPDDVPLNGTLALLIRIMQNDTVIGRELISRTVNPTYRTLHENAIGITVTNAGNLGYNDYPSNAQGQGITWNGGRSLVFEGGLLIGTEPTYLPNVVRGANASYRDYGFMGTGVVNFRSDSIENGVRAVSDYTDSVDRYPVGVSVRQQVYESTDDSLANSALLTYDITNTTTHTISSAYLALFFDWDLGNSGEDDGVAWDNKRGFAVIQNTIDRDIPTVGISMVSPYTLNVAAIDNAGGGGIPSIYDGFIRAEKWYTMSRGKVRTNSNIGDVSLMIGGGPIELAPGQTKQITFTLSIGANLEDVTRYMNSSRLFAQQQGLNAVPYQPSADADKIVSIANAPIFDAGDDVTVRFDLSNITPVEISVVDMMGKTVALPIVENELAGGQYVRSFSMPSVSSGVYFVVLKTYMGIDSESIQVIH